MIRAGLIGLGKMGISHQAILNTHPGVQLVAVCDTTRYLVDVMERFTDVRGYSDYRDLLAEAELDAVVVATPSRSHAEIVRAALDRRLHVFCEKPFCLDVEEGQRLADLASSTNRTNQVGYHYRFVGAFREARRIAASGALGRIHHVRVEAYGPVVLRPRGSTWRQSRDEGGGCLYDYACHGIDLVHALVGPPIGVRGSIVRRVFSRDVDDEVYSTLEFADDVSGQLAANWSDDSERRMSTQVELWGTNGRLVADRQECRVYLRDASVEGAAETGLGEGWTVRYTTELTDPVWFYLRGEEYSAQIDHFVDCIERGVAETASSFATAVTTDRVARMVADDARGLRPPSTPRPVAVAEPKLALAGRAGRELAARIPRAARASTRRARLFLEGRRP